MSFEEQVREAAQHVRPEWTSTRAAHVGDQIARSMAAKAAMKTLLLKLMGMGVLGAVIVAGVVGARAASGSFDPRSADTTQGVASVEPRAQEPPDSPDTTASAPEGAASTAPSVSTANTEALDVHKPGTAAGPASSAGSLTKTNGTSTASPAAADVWRTLAKQNRYDEAYAALHADARTYVRDEASDLWLAADTARLSKHPAEAAGYLRTLVSKFRSDSRSGLAAFTLGRVLLDQLGQPREAAGAFALVRSLSPSGALYEDALAREVEAWSRAGDKANARSSAEVYLSKYPTSQRRTSVRSFGGIE